MKNIAFTTLIALLPTTSVAFEETEEFIHSLEAFECTPNDNKYGINWFLVFQNTDDQVRLLGAPSDLVLNKTEQGYELKFSDDGDWYLSEIDEEYQLFTARPGGVETLECRDSTQAAKIIARALIEDEQTQAMAERDMSAVATIQNLNEQLAMVRQERNELLDRLSELVPEPKPNTSQIPSAESLLPPKADTLHQNIKLHISQCWNVGALSSAALKAEITVRFGIAKDGKTIATSIKVVPDDAGLSPAEEQLYQSVRRAIIRCGLRPMDLPAARYDEWKSVELTFSAADF